LLDRETWKFINTFAPWLAAFGTLSAVVTSLYLARRSDRVVLDVRVGIRSLAVRGGGPRHGTELLWVNITNLGRRSATLTALYWRPVPWRKAGWLWLAPENDLSSPFPTTLTDGQSANYAMPIAEFLKNFSGFARETFAGCTGWVRLRLLRFHVTTSTGQSFTAKPERSVLQQVRQLAVAPLDTALGKTLRDNADFAFHSSSGKSADVTGNKPQS
jgi:hypothetical protein